MSESMTNFDISMGSEELRNYVRDISDFPKQGIVFKDITPLLQNAALFRRVIDLLASRVDRQAEKIVAIESRGLILGAALAYELGIGFVPVRKPGKLPAKTFKATYTLEYGEDTLEIHQDALDPGTKVLLVDDLLATGGTMEATARLVKECGADVAGFAFLIELGFLNGRDKLEADKIVSLIRY